MEVVFSQQAELDLEEIDRPPPPKLPRAAFKTAV